MKTKRIHFCHALLMIIAAVLIVISSSLAYSLSELPVILLFAGIAAGLDALLLLVLRRDTALRDLVLLASVTLTTLALCKVLAGRADLMGYVWFSDLEKGNPAAVASLYLAVASMGCFLLGIILHIVAGFRKASPANPGA